MVLELDMIAKLKQVSKYLQMGQVESADALLDVMMFDLETQVEEFEREMEGFTGS